MKTVYRNVLKFAASLVVAALLPLMIAVPLVPMAGCTQAQKISVAQEIVNWAPVLVSTADTVNAAIEALDPATIVVLGPVTLGLNALAPQFVTAAQAYLANPSQTNLQFLQSLVTQIQQNANSALLVAVRIVNPTSQATAQKNINLIATIANTLLALIESISTGKQVTAMASHVTVTLAQVRPLMDERALAANGRQVALDLQLGHTPSADEFFAYEAQAGF